MSGSGLQKENALPSLEIEDRLLPETTVGNVFVQNPRISTRNVNVFYGDKQALVDVTVDIAEKEVIAFIGPSGCGKSTLLRSFNRMNDTIDSCRIEGQVLLDDQNIYDPCVDVVGLRARVGMVFQKPNPFPKSIFDNVAYGPKIHGLAESRVDLEEIVESSLARAGIWDELKDRLDQPGTGLSGGQQQRLCIARAIAVNPEVILMDEPLGALDALTREKMQSLVLELWKKTGKTIVIITHSVEEALLLGERLFVMAPRPGRIHKEYQLPFAEWGLGRSLRDIKLEKEFSAVREEILTMIWNMEEEIMGGA